MRHRSPDRSNSSINGKSKMACALQWDLATISGGAMWDFFNANEFWLLFVNTVLGLTTLICMIVIGRVAIREITEKRKVNRWLKELDDDHAFVVSDLGITMADGGKRVESAGSQLPGPRLAVSEQGLTEVEPARLAGKERILRPEDR
jgi:hypothetical protein